MLTLISYILFQNLTSTPNSLNINSAAYSQMTTTNIISPVIKNLTLNNNKVTGNALFTYKKSEDNFLPDKNCITRFSNPVPFSGYTVFNGSFKDSRYSTDQENSYDVYQNHGNPIQISLKNKAAIVYIQGYNKDYPTVKTENTTYTAGQLKNKKGKVLSANNYRYKNQ